MANIKSQIKRNRQNEKRRIRNKAVRSKVHSLEKKAIESQGTDQQEQTLKDAISAIDKASTKKVFHKNAAARRKSRLSKKVTSSN